MSVKKLVVIGESGVGKTCIACVRTRGEFHEELNTTIASNYYTFTQKVNDKEVVFQVWDTAGQEQYSDLIPIYLRGVQGIFIVFDLSNFERTFSSLGKWVEIARDADDKAPIIILGNKHDLHEMKSEEIDKIEDFCDRYQFPYLLTSAKINENIAEAFNAMAEEVCKENSPDEETPLPSTLQPREKSSCC